MYIKAQGLWGAGRLGRYFPIIERHWIGRIDGRLTLRDAMRRMVQEL
jgi:hypothetical protein